MKLSLLATLMLVGATANAADLTIEIIENSNAAATPTPEPTFWDKVGTNDSYGDLATGIGARVKTGTTENAGAFATIRFRGYQTWDSANPIIIGNAGANFNVFNRESTTKNLSTEIGGFANLFVGYSFNKDKSGVDFLIGGGTHLNGSGSAYSKEQSQFQGFIGPETGLHYQDDKIVATLTGSVALGGTTCTVNTENGDEFQFNSNSVGFVGIGRVLLGDRGALNVIYASFPRNESEADNQRFQGSNLFDATLFWNIGEKLTLTGNCTINGMYTEVYGLKDDAGQPLPNQVHELNMNNFQIGLIRRFGK